MKNFPVDEDGQTDVLAAGGDYVIVDEERGIVANISFVVISNGDFWKYRALAGKEAF